MTGPQQIHTDQKLRSAKQQLKGPETRRAVTRVSSSDWCWEQPLHSPSAGGHHSHRRRWVWWESHCRRASQVGNSLQWETPDLLFPAERKKTRRWMDEDDKWTNREPAARMVTHSLIQWQTGMKMRRFMLKARVQSEQWCDKPGVSNWGANNLLCNNMAL